MVNLTKFVCECWILSRRFDDYSGKRRHGSETMAGKLFVDMAIWLEFAVDLCASFGNVSLIITGMSTNSASRILTTFGPRLDVYVQTFPHRRFHFPGLS